MLYKCVGHVLLTRLSNGSAFVSNVFFMNRLSHLPSVANVTHFIIHAALPVPFIIDTALILYSVRLSDHIVLLATAASVLFASYFVVSAEASHFG